MDITLDILYIQQVIMSFVMQPIFWFCVMALLLYNIIGSIFLKFGQVIMFFFGIFLYNVGVVGR